LPQDKEVIVAHTPGDDGRYADLDFAVHDAFAGAPRVAGPDEAPSRPREDASESVAGVMRAGRGALLLSRTNERFLVLSRAGPNGRPSDEAFRCS
jgi:hypothetical protein